MKRRMILLVLISLGIAGSCNKGENPVSESNQPPLTPVIDVQAGSPPHQSASQSTRPTLRWTCTDPDGDALKYDVYFDTNSSPRITVTDQSTTSYSPGLLKYSETYFWKIAAKDSHGHETSSPIWKFTTITEPSETITSPNQPSGPSTGTTGETLSFATGGSSSSLSHAVQYQFDWGDGSFSDWALSSTASHSWVNSDSYSVRAQGRCETHNDKISTWSQSLPLNITSPENPTLAASPTILNFDNAETTLSFIIRNTGTGALTWNISEGMSWLQVNPASGTTQTETDQVSVTVNRTNLDCGGYSGTILITSNGGEARVDVNMKVTESGKLVISPSSLDFGSSTSRLCLTLTVSDCDCGGCDWTATESCSWLTLTPSSGNTGCETDQVCVDVSRSGLSCGSYTCAISFTSSCGQMIPISVVMKVSGNPKLAISPTILDFGLNDWNKIVSITNPQYTCGNLSWQLTTSESW
ncbi:BACON domain-containing protein, partial [Patescibacteria group bacterium]|nr:BACON domain-containing protein [Patescibacteria group bacterium]